jgi:hypothetical protein
VVSALSHDAFVTGALHEHLAWTQGGGENNASTAGLGGPVRWSFVSKDEHITERLFSTVMLSQ